MAAGCHNPANLGTGAPPWSFAGTIYTASGGSTPAPAAVVRVLDANSQLYIAVADQDGNFSFYTATPIAFPAQTNVTSCPTLTSMGTTITATGQGGCNSCHSTTPGSQSTPLGLM
ncbi:MAG TPA: hypothetical protein VMJ10_23750 [Kofleriaceae bacterium]|nr:hypothetical protein [Kofleriaceae bacterium]